MFVIMGVAGIVSGSLWFIFYRDPTTVTLAEDEQAYLRDGKPAVTQHLMTFARWRRLLTLRTTWGVLLGFIGYNSLDAIYRYWLPGYLEIEHHLSIALTGMVATIPLTSAIVGSLCGAFFAIEVKRPGKEPTPIQVRRMREIIRTNGLAVAGTAEVVVQVLRDWLAVRGITA